MSCSGNQTYDEGCSNCSSCNSGEYILSPPGQLCNGMGFRDTAAGWCRKCRSACSSGFYLNASMCLSGSDTADRNCIPCNTKCASGFYAFGRCDGTSFVDARKCVACSTCLQGQVQTAFCYGNSTEDSTKCRTCNATSCPPPQVKTFIPFVYPFCIIAAHVSNSHAKSAGLDESVHWIGHSGQKQVYGLWKHMWGPGIHVQAVLICTVQCHWIVSSCQSVRQHMHCMQEQM